MITPLQRFIKDLETLLPHSVVHLEESTMYVLQRLYQFNCSNFVLHKDFVAFHLISFASNILTQVVF